jgi:hypothetical protein
MTPKLSRKFRISAAAGAMLSTAIAGGYAFAITSNAFTYSPELNGALMIDPMDLSPDGNESAGNYHIDYPDGRLIAGGSSCFSTGLHLPQGAKLVELRIFHASLSTSDLSFFLVKHVPATGANVSILTTGIPDNSGTRKATAFDLTANANRVINNATGGYGLGICVGASDTFFGARIAYSYSSAGD